MFRLRNRNEIEIEIRSCARAAEDLRRLGRPSALHLHPHRKLEERRGEERPSLPLANIIIIGIGPDKTEFVMILLLLRSNGSLNAILQYYTTLTFEVGFL